MDSVGQIVQMQPGKKRRRSSTDLVIHYLRKHTFESLDHLAEQLQRDQAHLATQLAARLAEAGGFMLVPKPEDGLLWTQMGPDDLDALRELQAQKGVA